MKNKLLTLLTSLLLFTNGCSAKEHKKDVSIAIDFETFKKGRVCSDVTFMCLPESLDKVWQSKELKDKADSVILTPERMKRYKYIVAAWRLDKEERGKRGMLVSDLDKDFFKKVKAKQFLIEMEEMLEKEFPGFWKGVKKAVRYRWIRRAMAKSKKLGYADGEITDNIQVIELCARIGLDFDLDPKWDYITKFVTMPDGELLAYGNIAVRYIDFTVFNKNIDRYGRPINDWSLRVALRHLPQPKRTVPRLNN